MGKFDWRYVTLFVLILVWSVNGGIEGVIKVNYKFSGSERNLRALKAHDEMRHLRILAGIDLPIGGIGRPDSVGLYYAKIGVGTPSNSYYVQVDTGSDIMWVNCITCQECPRRGYHGLELTLYNPRDSLTGKLIVCGHSFCKDIDRGSGSGCSGNTSCTYSQVYGDGSYSRGYFVEDVVQYDQVSGDLQTKSSNGSVIFGCGASQSGDLSSSDEALDGVLGFGKSNSSMLSQLASSGRVTKKFAHCLDSVNGGGIFAIGNVVQPKVNMTPLVPNQPHYNVNMMAVEVGYQFLNLSVDVLMNGENNGVIIDSGTTLAYLPEVIYGPLVKKIFSWQPDLKLRTIHDEYTCFEYSGSVFILEQWQLDSKGPSCYQLYSTSQDIVRKSVDDGFPQVTFHFENSLSLRVRPHEYLFPYEDLFCIGWQNSGTQSRDKWNLTLFGGSSSIELKDEITGSVRLVGAHSLSSGSSLTAQMALTIFLLLVALLHNYLFNW
uniref:Aspartic proteinase-like protein 2 isoform X2 n=1 Tax=Nicotiana sylvestris TaxID=4096 RepID=A0A1U7X7K7_NICSY|nr:PREDICTED: aspartic proteinase-like protein 2 isoform X2 [Nicotiana sylvestris]